MSSLDLHVLTLEKLRAEEGYRAVIYIDSEPYQVGKDVPTKEEARSLCLAGRVMAQWQVYDEQGKEQFLEE
jgi:hypothetical protein